MGDYGPPWKLHRKLFVTALRQYLNDIPIIEQTISREVYNLLTFMESQGGNAFDPGDILAHAVANVICKITFGEEYDTSHPDMERMLMLNQKLFASFKDVQTILMLDFFPITEYLPEIPAYKRIFPLKDETFDLIQGFLDTRKQEFDPTKPVHDLISGLLQARSKATDVGADDRTALF